MANVLCEKQSYCQRQKEKIIAVNGAGWPRQAKVTHEKHKEYAKKERKKGGLDPMVIPMLADRTTQISSDYGCLCQIPGGDAGCAYRATYIIDREGVLRHMTIGDMPVGRNVDEVLRLVQAFQYADEYGEVCPSQWKPGGKTMNPSHEGEKTQQYWENEHK